jgi:hypothetical protein
LEENIVIVTLPLLTNSFEKSKTIPVPGREGP